MRPLECAFARLRPGRLAGAVLRAGRGCRQAVCLSGQHHDNSCSLTPAYGPPLSSVHRHPSPASTGFTSEPFLQSPAAAKLPREA